MLKINDIYDTFKNIMELSKNFSFNPSITIGDKSNPDVIYPFEIEDFTSWNDFDKDGNRNHLDGALVFSLKDKELEPGDIVRIKDSLLSSYVSIFNLIIDEDSYKAFDLMTKNSFSLAKTPALSDLKSGMYVMRIAFFDDDVFALHILRKVRDESFDESVEKEWKNFLEIKNFSLKSKDEMISILKKHLPDLLLIYYLIDHDIYDLVQAGKRVGIYDRVVPAFSKEDFKVFKNFVERLNVKNFNDINTDEEALVSFFAQFYENFLKKQNFTYTSYNMPFDMIIKNSCIDGFYPTGEALSDGINLFYDFYTMLKDEGRNVDYILYCLENSKNNILNLQNTLKSTPKGFYIDENILQCVVESENDEDSDFLENYETFLDIVENEYITILSSDNISPGILIELAKTFGIKPTREVKNYKNYHFPLIQVFLSFSKAKDILKTEVFENTKYLTFDESAEKYFIMPDEIKKTVWIKTILDKNFLKKTFENDAKKYSEFTIDFITDLNNDKRVMNYDIKKEFLPIVDGLESFGVIKKDRYYKLTKFGKTLFDYYSLANKKDNVIKVDFSK